MYIFLFNLFQVYKRWIFNCVFVCFSWSYKHSSPWFTTQDIYWRSTKLFERRPGNKIPVHVISLCSVVPHLALVILPQPAPWTKTFNFILIFILYKKKCIFSSRLLYPFLILFQCWKNYEITSLYQKKFYLIVFISDCREAGCVDTAAQCVVCKAEARCSQFYSGWTTCCLHVWCWF